MRKLYALLAGILLILAGNNSANAKKISPDVANFIFTINGNDVVFSNTSTLGNEPGLRKAYWHFGDGVVQQTPPLQGTQHHYQVAGTYTVCLKIYRYLNNTNDSVLSAQVCKTLVIQSTAVCQANFEYHDSIASLNPLRHLVQFHAIPLHSANKPVIQVCWNFGDGTDTCINATATIPNTNLLTVYHTYLQQGPYNACVRIKYLDGCIAEKCRSVVLLQPPADSCSADFERLPVTTSNNPLQVTLKALPWHNNVKKPVRVCWNFGDGNDTCINYTNTYSGLYTVTHTYPHPGLYNTCVKIYYTGGCTAGNCKPVQAGRPDTCRADFEKIPLTPNNNPLHVLYRALPDHNNNRKPSRICWQFGDGSDTCINYNETYTGAYTAGHRYDHRGLYEVCVKINYFGGCEARKCKPVRVGPPDSCSADFERIPTVATTPLTIGFKALPWNSDNRKPARVCWTFGDGRDTCINYPDNYTSLYSVIHHYNNAGQYEVCVKIFYYGGCDAIKCKPIIIPPLPVNCSVRLFEITPSITSLIRRFMAVPLPTTGNNRPVRICWTFGDGEDTCIMLNNTQPFPYYIISHTYPGPGIYRACVRVRFENGCIAEDCKEVVIRSASSICGGFMTDSLIAPRTFRFNGHSIHAPNDEVISYRWTFGDGTSALGREVTHTYTTAGNFEVCLYIKTRLGCETRICRTVRIPGNNQPALILSPNPVINLLNAAFFSTHTETVTIRILNSTGNVVRTYSRNANVGPNSWSFDLSNLLPGVYSFIVQSPNQLASAIFLKQ